MSSSSHQLTHQDKVNATSHLLLRRSLISWIEEILSVKFKETMEEELKNGVVLCYLITTIAPNSVPLIHDEPGARGFKCLENVHFFIAAARELGVDEHTLFWPEDLIEGKRFEKVVATLRDVARIAAARSRAPPLPEPAEQDEAAAAAEVNELPTATAKRLATTYEQITKEKKRVKLVKLSPIVFERQLDLMLSSRPDKEHILDTLTKGVTRLQAYGRGFLARRRFRELSRNAAFRYNISHEFYQTEVDFFYNICSCMEYYCIPMTIDASAHKDGLTHESVQELFYGLTTVCQFSYKLVGVMKPFFASWNCNSCFGKLIKETVSDLSSYTTAILNYNKAMNTYSEMLKNDDFKQTIHERQANPKHQKHLDLPSYLIMPIQRIPRYILLLQDLLKHTEADHQDHEALLEAVQSVKKAATDLNNMKKINESTILLETLSTKVQNIPQNISIVSESRLSIEDIEIYFLNENEEKVPGKFYLFNDSFLITKIEEVKEKQTFMWFWTSESVTQCEKYVFFHGHEKGYLKKIDAQTIKVGDDLVFYATALSAEHLIEAYSKVEQELRTQQLEHTSQSPDLLLRSRRLGKKHDSAEVHISRSSYARTLKFDKDVEKKLSELREVVALPKQ